MVPPFLVKVLEAASKRWTTVQSRWRWLATLQDKKMSCLLRE